MNLAEFAEMLDRWAAWAEAEVEVEGWEGTRPGQTVVPAAAWEPGAGSGQAGGDTAPA